MQSKNHQALFFLLKKRTLPYWIIFSLEAKDLRLSNVTGSYVRDFMSNGQCKKIH